MENKKICPLLRAKNPDGIDTVIEPIFPKTNLAKFSKQFYDEIYTRIFSPVISYEAYFTWLIFLYFTPIFYTQILNTKT